MSDDAPSGGKAGVLLVILGLWLLGQTLVGGLVGRILGLAKSSGSSPSTPSPPANTTPPTNEVTTTGPSGAPTGQPQKVPTSVTGNPIPQGGPPIGAPGLGILGVNTPPIGGSVF